MRITRCARLHLTDPLGAARRHFPGTRYGALGAVGRACGHPALNDAAKPPQEPARALRRDSRGCGGRPGPPGPRRGVARVRDSWPGPTVDGCPWSHRTKAPTSVDRKILGLSATEKAPRRAPPGQRRNPPNFHGRPSGDARVNLPGTCAIVVPHAAPSYSMRISSSTALLIDLLVNCLSGLRWLDARVIAQRRSHIASDSAGPQAQ